MLGNNAYQSLISLLLLTLTVACSGEGGALKGRTQISSSGSSNSEVVQDPAGPKYSSEAAPQAPLDNPKADPLMTAEGKEDESVTVPKAVSGAYLTCPVLQQNAVNVQIGCSFASNVSREKIPLDSLYLSGDFKPDVDSSVRVAINASPGNGWSRVINLTFQDVAQRDSVLPKLKIDFEGITLEGEPSALKTSVELLPASTTKSGNRYNAIRSIRSGDNTYLGYIANPDGSKSAATDVLTFSTNVGMSTAWAITDKGEIRNPLGICVRLGVDMVSAQYIDCASGNFTKFEWDGSHIKIRGVNTCLQTTMFDATGLGINPAPRYALYAVACDRNNPSQNFENVPGQ